MGAINLIEGANSLNPTKDAFDRKSLELGNERAAEQASEMKAQTKRDNDMLKAFDYAGDGNIEQAQYIAKAGGFTLPPETLSNADMSKGIALAGKLYGGDKNNAQKFSLAWMQLSDIDDPRERALKASENTGFALDPNDRKFRQAMEMEVFKNNLKRGNRREDVFIKGIESSFGDPNAGVSALKSYDEQFPQNATLSRGLVGGGVPRMSMQDLEAGSNDVGIGSPTPVAPPQSEQFTPERIYQDAIDAIASGKSREAVYAKLRDNGLDPSIVENKILNQYQGQGTVPTKPPEINMIQESGAGYNPKTGYFSELPQDARLQALSKGLANVVNIPAHINKATNAGVSALRGGVNLVSDTAEGITDYLGSSPNVLVTAPNGNQGYIPKEQLDEALSKGYRLGGGNIEVSPPISQ